MSLNAVERVAQEGFGKSVDYYENARPSYPAEAITILEKVLGLIPNVSHVVDLGAGTGKMTRLLSNAGYHISAVEPAEAMRKKFAKILPTIPIMNGNSWNIPIPSNSLDAVVVAQAFHWFANLNTLKEVHRVLKPGGGFGLIWNLEDRENKEWVAVLRDYYEQFELNSPQYRLGLWKQVWKAEAAKKLFSPIQRESVSHFVCSTKETIRQRIMSKSYIACQEGKIQEEISENIAHILETAADIDYEDEQNGIVSFPYTTDIVWCKKL